jgi:hypothetical protein
MRKKITFGLLLVLAALVTAPPALKAQNKLKRAAADTVVAANLAALFSVSPEKALQIRQAMTYRQDELANVMKDPKLKAAERQKIIARLLAERHRKIDSALTRAQKALLMQHDSAALQKRSAMLAGQIREQVKKDSAVRKLKTN